MDMKRDDEAIALQKVATGQSSPCCRSGGLIKFFLVFENPFAVMFFVRFFASLLPTQNLRCRKCKCHFHIKD